MPLKSVSSIRSPSLPTKLRAGAGCGASAGLNFCMLPSMGGRAALACPASDANHHPVAQTIPSIAAAVKLRILTTFFISRPTLFPLALNKLHPMTEKDTPKSTSANSNPGSSRGAANQLWGGRFASGPAAIMEASTPRSASTSGWRPRTSRGSKAHAAMLAAAGHHLRQRCRQRSWRAWTRSLAEIEAGSFTFSRALEDIHMNVESAAGRADRRAGRTAAHRALAQRPGRDRLPALGARRAATARRAADRRCSARWSSRPRRMPTTVMPGFTHLQSGAAGDLRPPPAGLCRDARPRPRPVRAMPARG